MTRVPDSAARSALEATVRSSSRPRAHLALTSLLREALLGGWGVLTARILALLLAAGALGCVAMISQGKPSDGPVLAILKLGAATIVLVAGSTAAIALSAPPKDTAHGASLRALARSRWLTDGELARAEMLATCGLVVEIVAIPVAVLALFVFAFVGHAEPGRWMIPLVGTTLFSVLAAVMLGAVSTACRWWGRPAGRRWFFAVMVLPWVLCPALFGEPTGEWLSVPGLLAQMWRALTQVPS